MLIRTLIVMSLCLVASTQRDLSVARELLRQQRYDAALATLEEFLEASPRHAEALSLMGTTHLYRRRDFLKAKSLFEESFRKGGGATFWVHHSHEKFGDALLADYCRGWLYFDKNGMTFTTDFAGHSFELKYSAVKEIKQNRLVPSHFHVKDGARNFNFSPRTGDEGEVWLIVAMYKKFSNP